MPAPAYGVFLIFLPYKLISFCELYDSFWSGTLVSNKFPKEKGVLWA